MADIGIYTTRETLEHKQKDGMLPDYCYWWFHNRPKKFENGDKIFFAVDCEWQGYFEKCWIGVGAEICFYSNDWVELKTKSPRKHFQGFTYNVPKVK